MLVARLEVLGAVDERGAVRFLVDHETTVRGLDGVPFDAVVEDFSRTGFRFLSDVEFPVGTLISIGLSGAGAREAKVVWRDDRAHGCEFLMPLPRREMERAFKGQADVVADLEAALARRFDAEEAPAPAPPRPRWPGLVPLAWRWLRRRRAGA